MLRVARILLVLFLVATWGLPLCGEATAAEYDYVGVVTSVTPFDSRYRRIQTYLEREKPGYPQSSAISQTSDPSDQLSVLKQYLKIAWRFKYVPDERGWGDTADGPPVYFHGVDESSRDYWQLPEETEARGAGDCEDIAVWLYATLIRLGFENVRLVVGRHRIDKPMNHAWVVYYLNGKVYILDPTMNRGLWEARQYPEGFYKPVYSYSKGSRWHHKSGYRQRLTDAAAKKENTELAVPTLHFNREGLDVPTGPRILHDER